MRTIVALYDDFDVAQDVVEDLVEAGFPRESISMMANDAAGELASVLDRDVSGAEGASFGAVVGGLIGLGAMLIPGVGPVLAAGPLVAALVGAGVGATVGAVTGGITASLIDLGVDEEYAGYYAEGVRRGGTLVVAHADDAWEDRVREVMSRHNPVDISTRASEWRDSGWRGFDETSPPPTSDQTTMTRESNTTTTDGSGTRSTTQGEASSRLATSQADEPVAAEAYVVEEVVAAAPATDSATTYQPFESYNDNYRTHFNSMYGTSGHPYDYYVPAYRYGYMLATDPRYHDYRWEQLEPEIRRNWEDYNKGTWEEVKDAIRHAWNQIRGIFD